MNVRLCGDLTVAYTRHGLAVGPAVIVRLQHLLEVNRCTFLVERFFSRAAVGVVGSVTAAEATTVSEKLEKPVTTTVRGLLTAYTRPSRVYIGL